MTTRHFRRRLAAAPIFGIVLLAASLGRKEVIALANAKFPEIMNRSVPARFLVMVFDSTDRYLWGFPVSGTVVFNVGADTLTPEERRTLQAGGRIAASKGGRSAHPYTSTFPAFVRDSTRALRMLPANADDGLIPTAPRSDESGIDGVFARDIRYVDRFQLYPGEDPPLQFDIFAVHLVGVRADTARPVRTSVPHVLPPVRPATPPANVKKKASVKSLVILPVPIPEAASPYELEACFDVAPSGDAKLLSWTRSRDLDYNSKVKKSLDRYLFRPATLNGVAVRDTVCVRAKTARPPGR